MSNPIREICRRVSIKFLQYHKKYPLQRNVRYFHKYISLCQKIDEIVRIGTHPTREFDIPVPWGRISARQSGSMDGKPILALHGLLENAASFDRLIPLLPYEWNIITFDLPGHGKSSHLPAGPCYYFHEFISSIGRVVSHLHWEKFDLIGHSYGGELAILFAGLYPLKVKHLITLDAIKPFTLPANNPDIWKEFTKSYDKLIKYERTRKTRHVYSTEEATRKIGEKISGSLTHESALILSKRSTKQLLHGVVFTRDKRLSFPLSGPTTCTTEQFYTLIPNMECGFLIIKAKQGSWKERKEVYEASKELYRKHCHRFKYVEVDGTHHVHLNNPENIVNHIIMFIRRGE